MKTTTTSRNLLLLLAASLALAAIASAAEECDTCQYVGGDLDCYGGVPVPFMFETEGFTPSLENFAVVHNNPDVAISFEAVLEKNGTKASFWHDIPTSPPTEGEEGDALFVNFVPEIRKGAIGKLEIMKDLPGNPVKYDTKPVTDSAGDFLYKRPRYVAYGPSPFTYGAIPQTWENSLEPDPVTGIIGDNDPIDALDIGAAVPDIGFPYKAKVLGTLGLIDDNETDWKVITINAEDPAAAKYDSIADVPAAVKEAIFTYFRDKPVAVGDAPGVFWPELSDAYLPGVWSSLEETKEIIAHTKQVRSEHTLSLPLSLSLSLLSLSLSLWSADTFFLRSFLPPLSRLTPTSSATAPRSRSWSLPTRGATRTTPPPRAEG